MLTVALIAGTIEELNKSFHFLPFLFFSVKSDPTINRSHATASGLPQETQHSHPRDGTQGGSSPAALTRRGGQGAGVGGEAAGSPRPQTREAAGTPRPEAGRQGPPAAEAFPRHRRGLPASADSQGTGARAAKSSSPRPPAAFRPYSHCWRAGGRLGEERRRRGGNKAENNFPLPRSWRCPAEPSAPLGGAGQRRRGLSTARRERAAPSFPPFFPPSRGRRRGAGPGEGTRSPDPRNAARPPRGLPPARHREGLLPAEPLRRACSAAGGLAQGAPRSRLTTPRAAPGAAHLGGHGAAGAGWAAGLPSPPRAAAARSVRPARPPPLGRAGGSSSASPSRRRHRRRLGAVGRLSSKPWRWAGGG